MGQIIQAYPDCLADPDSLWTRLDDTIAWCKSRLRFQPSPSLLRLDSPSSRDLESDGFTAVRSVADLHALERRRSAPVRDLRDGRLLLYFPNANLACGAAEVESDGYFDDQNAPPNGTWVGFFREAALTNPSYSSYLLAWVPPPFISAASVGIEVNPEECIGWLCMRDVALRETVPDLCSLTG